MQDLTTISNFTEKQAALHSKCADLLFKISTAIEAAQDRENELDYRQKYGKPTGCWDDVSSDTLEAEFTAKAHEVATLMEQYADLAISLHTGIKSFTLSITSSIAA